MKRLLLASLLATLIILPLNCGSGGGKDSRFLKRIQGLLKDGELSTALAGALVTILQTGDSTISDENGAFVLDIRTDELAIEVLVEGNNLDGNEYSAIILVEDLSNDEELLVDIVATLDRNTLQFFLNSLKLFLGTLVPDSTAKPTPETTPVPSVDPTPAPTTAQPTQNPITPAPTIQATPTAVPTTPPVTPAPTNTLTPVPSATPAPTPVPTQSQPATPTATPTSNPTSTPTLTATPTPTVVPAVCGDGIVEGNEQCDDGTETSTCDGDCTFVQCGDGTINQRAQEQCDDNGNATANCDPDCTLPVCGDRFVNPAAGEQCDPPDTLSVGGCDRRCQFNVF